MSSLNAGLVLYLNFNHISSDNKVIDASGNGNKGTLYGNTQVVSDESFGKCLSLDGVDDYVDTGIAFPNITDTFTIEGWVSPEIEHQIDAESNNAAVGTAGQKYMIWPTHGDRAYGSGHAGAGISVGTNGVSVYEHADSYMPALLVWQGIVSKSKWTHISVVYQNKQPSLYINGEFIKKGLASSKIVHPSAGKGNVYPGQTGGIGGGTNGYFQGKIANIRIYNRALSSEQIRQDIQDDLLGLALHIKFDTVTSDKKVIDDSGNENHGVINGNIKVVNDETKTFVRCLSSDGTNGYVEVGDPFRNRTAFTLSLWVKPSVLNDGAYYGFIGKQEDTVRKPGLWLSPSNGGLHYDSSDTSRTKFSGILDNFFRSAGEWVHVAWVKAGTEYKFYRNGELVATKPAPEQFYTAESTSYWIGKVDKYWKGEIAHVRIYSRALLAEEIQQVVEEDQPSLAAFRKSHPIGFSLHDDNDEHCLYITDDAKGQSLHLEISNTSEQNIELAALSGSDAILHNHHFELRFKPGTLHLTSLGQISVADKDWKLSSKEQIDRTISLYFLYNNTSAIKKLEPTEKIDLTLLNVRASTDGGARVTQVELKSQKLRYQNETTAFISDSRVQRLSVINHLGKQNIPLHVGFVGSNTILNDAVKQTDGSWKGTSNELKLRITNVLKKDDITLNPKGNSKPSKLIISFDVQGENETKEWALGTKSEVVNIQLAATGWDIHKETEGESPEWILTPQTPITLAGGGHNEIKLSNIISSLPSGHTNLYVHYENIPGYWDGQFVVTIEKTPILYRGSHVGIGTADPTGTLDVARGNAPSGTVIFRGTERHSHFNYNADEHTYIRGGKNSSNVYINDNGGNVGIGTTNPTAKLHIQGDHPTGEVWEAIGLHYNRWWTNQGTAINFYNSPGNVRKIEAQIRTYVAQGGPTDIIFSTVISSNGQLQEIMRLKPTGNVSITGALTQSSSRELKENIVELSSAEAIATLEGLNPLKFNYKAASQKETHIGFIAEDVPELVASPDRKHLSAMDIVAVLTKVVKEQQEAISVLQEKLKALEGKN